MTKASPATIKTWWPPATRGSSASNAAAIDRGAFENVIGIATVVDGKPMTVTQGVHEQLTESLIPWFLGNFDLSREDAVAEAEAWAEIITRGILMTSGRSLMAARV